MPQPKQADSLPLVHASGLFAVLFGGLAVAQLVEMIRGSERSEWWMLVFYAVSALVWAGAARVHWRKRPRSPESADSVDQRGCDQPPPPVG